MNTIKELAASLLRQEESYGFHSLAVNEFAKCNHPKFIEKLGVYKDCLAQFDGALKQGGKSESTAKITLLDEQRDAAYLGLVRQVRNTLHHFNARRAEAAQKIQNILNKYSDPRSLPYIQESGILENLLQDLNAADAKANVALVGANEWKDELQRANNEFMALFANRNEEQATVVTGLSKEARTETDNAYRNCVRRLNALIELDGDAEYASIVSNLNKLIDYQKQVISARKTHNQAQASANGELKVEN